MWMKLEMTLNIVKLLVLMVIRDNIEIHNART